MKGLKKDNILLLLVTCSRDETRRDLAMQVVKNLAEKVTEGGFQNHFVIFDNASIFRNHLAFAPQGTRIIQSEENIGYWSAIDWVLANYSTLMGQEYDYIYMIESDLYHNDLRPLASCASYLDQTPTASCVRTQEFSVGQRWRYDKALKFLPFHVIRSEIALKNLVTGEKAWFKKSIVPSIYDSNLHAKLPALNRISAMKLCFDALRNMGDFKEGDFFALMHKLYHHIGVYNGGLFYSLFKRGDKGVLSGSYAKQDELKSTGYQQTRYARILSPQADLKITRV